MVPVSFVPVPKTLPMPQPIWPTPVQNRGVIPIQRDVFQPALHFGIDTEASKAYHKSDALGDHYERYHPANTNVPPALNHTIVSSEARRAHHALAEELELYIAGRGHKSLSIPWISHRLPLSAMEYTVFDVETTGLDSNARIIQLAASPVKSNHQMDHQRDFSQLFHPGMIEGTDRPFRIEPQATAIHGISLEQLANKKQIADLLPALRQNNQLSILGDRRLLVAYNARFDVGRLNEAIRLFNKIRQKSSDKIPELSPELVVDPFVLIQRLHPFNSQKKTLGTVYKTLMGCELQNKHDAQADVDATVDVLKYVLKVLQKHAIPQEWGKLAEAPLQKLHGPQWDQFSSIEKASLIAGYVAKHRKFFEERYPQFLARPIRAIDVLRFQFGRMSCHDGPTPHYPVFDITLDQFGVDGCKYWDGTDRLDLDLVREVRHERQEENLALLVHQFKKEFPKKSLEGLVQELRQLARPDLTDLKQQRAFEQKLTQEILNSIGKRIAYKILKREHPKPGELAQANRAFLGELKNSLADLSEVLIEKKMRRYMDLAQFPQMEAHLKPLTEQIVAQTGKALDKLSNRFLYAYIDVDLNALTSPPNALTTSSDMLIDPAVIQAYQAAKTKEKNGTPLIYQNPDPHKRGVYQHPIEGNSPVHESGENKYPVEQALVLEQPWLEKILDGEKTWEIRGGNTYFRGWLGLIDRDAQDDDGRRLLKGIAYLDAVKGPLSRKDIENNVKHHRIPKAFLDFYSGVRYKKPFAWVLKDAQRLDPPIPVQVQTNKGSFVSLPEANRKALAKFVPAPKA